MMMYYGSDSLLLLFFCLSIFAVVVAYIQI